MEIGSKIKNLRLQKGLTQEELGDRCELSKAFISLLESDKTSPSMATLEDILNVLGTDFAHFFKEESSKRVVYGKDDYSVKKDTDLKNEMEPILVTIEPGGSTYPDNPHEGEEVGYVTEGVITIVIDNEKYQAKKGESFYIACDKPHYLENTTNKPAKAIWISAPPSF